MKNRLMKVLLIGLLAVAPVSAGQLLKQSTATQVTLKWSDATDGVTPETAYTTVGNAVVQLVKHADSGMAATTLTLTAAAGSNDSAFLAGSAGVATLELTATDTNTLGRLDLYANCGTTCITGGAVPYEAHFTVVAAAVYDSLTSAISTIDDYWEHLTSSIGTAGSIGTQLKTYVQPNQTVPRAAEYANFTFSMYNSTTGAILSGATVTGTISQDGGVFGALTNAISEIGVTGRYKVTLTAAEMTADEVYLVFTATGARVMEFKMRPQK